QQQANLERLIIGHWKQSIPELEGVTLGQALGRLREHPEGWRLAQQPEAQAALVAVSPQDGRVMALVGGLDFRANQFNRATQSRRQPGSAFKPFIYAGAIDYGYTPASLVNDAPVVFNDPSQERDWKPTNFSEEFFGPTRLREGMIHSRNLISVRLLMDIGLQPMTEYVSQFGFNRSALPNGPSMALGAAAVTPLDLAGAYAIFANGGYRIAPHWVLAVLDGNGEMVDEIEHPVICRDCPPPRWPQPVVESTESLDSDSYEDAPRELALNLDPDAERSIDGIEPVVELMGPPVPIYAEQVIDPPTAWLIRSMMSDVIRLGTGRRALALERGDLAGKTGTTNDQRDTWFAGFNDQIVTTVWVGMDSNESLGRNEQGGRTALPIWVDFMQTAIETMPEHDDPLPIGVVQARIDPVSGLRARPGNLDAIPEWFKAGNLPDLQPQLTEQDDEQDDVDPYRIF
ncbi:MAG: penicillin-binding transpeptidase domain-containing protein, partial [Pseudomonadota bacterium]